MEYATDVPTSLFSESYNFIFISKDLLVKRVTSGEFVVKCSCI